MPLVESLRFLITADSTSAVSEFQKLEKATKTVTELEAKLKQLSSDQSAGGLAKFARLSGPLQSALAQARGELDRLTAASGRSASGLDRLKGGLAQGLGFGTAVAGVTTLVNGLERVGSFAVDQIGKAVGAASDLQQSAGTTAAIFGAAGAAVKEFGADAADAVGLSNAAFQQQTAVIGALLQNLGYTQKAAADLSIELVKSGSDLGATFGRSTASAVEGISAVLRGEYDTIEKLGIKIKQADIDARVLKLGLDTSTQALKNNAQATAALALFREQAAKSAGTFAEKENTLLGQQQRFNAELENARAELGQAFLPAMTQAVSIGRDLIPVVSLGADAYIQFARGLIDAAREANNLVDALGPLKYVVSPIKALGSLSGGGILGTDTGGLLGPLAQAKDAVTALQQKAADGKLSLAQLLPAISALPPATQKWIQATYEAATALDGATQSTKNLAAATTALGSIGESLFGAERQQTAFNKSLEASGGAANSARSQAKAYESALRRIEDAERGVSDAQENLNETLIQRFLVGLGASSDEITSAQIRERESTRSLAESKLRLIDAERELARLKGGGAAASRLEAQAAFLDAQKQLADAQKTGDPSQLLKAKAALLKAQQGLDDTSASKQAQDIARAQLAVEAAADDVTKAAIDQREAQKNLNDTLIKGKEGSLELRDANRAVEDAQRRLEGATRDLDDAQDGLVDALDRTSAAGKTAAERFDDGVKAADSWIQFLIKNKATPDKFAEAVTAISTGLATVATEAGKTDALDAYNQKLRDTLQLYTDLGGFGSKQASAIFPKTTPVSSTSTANSAERTLQTINLQVDGKTLAQVVVDQSNQQGGLPIKIKSTS